MYIYMYIYAYVHTSRYSNHTISIGESWINTFPYSFQITVRAFWDCEKLRNPSYITFIYIYNGVLLKRNRRNRNIELSHEDVDKSIDNYPLGNVNQFRKWIPGTDILHLTSYMLSQSEIPKIHFWLLSRNIAIDFGHLNIGGNTGWLG